MPPGLSQHQRYSGQTQSSVTRSNLRLRENSVCHQMWSALSQTQEQGTDISPGLHKSKLASLICQAN